MGLSVDQISRLYRIPVIDYVADSHYAYGRDDDWLLVTAGSGLMLSIMDIEPRFRYCIDADGIKDALGDGYRFGQWLIGMERLVRRIAFAGWYSNPLNAGSICCDLAKLRSPRFISYFGGATANFPFEVRNRVHTLEEFMDRLNQEQNNEPAVEDSFR